MTSCNSWTSFSINLWDEYGKAAKKVVAGAGGIATAVATKNPAAGVEAALNILETEDKIEAAIKEAEKNYHKVVSKTSSLTIGPRLLPFNRWQSGTIVSTTGRVFITAAPMDEDIVKIELRETGGKGKVGIAMCVFGPDGSSDKVASYLLNEDRSEKRDKGQTIIKTIPHVRGHFIGIHIDGKSVANTFRYKLKLRT